MNTKPNVCIVAFVVDLARSGQYNARQIKSLTLAEFAGAVSTDEISASILDAAKRLKKQHEK